jgi:Leucine-rich repeat (LRR) protein/GTPase SAR1 family protein
LTALPPEITQLTSLQRLMLDGNQLTALPPEITQLTSLQMLTLSRNQLTALPPEITQLTSLQMLMLSRNQLTALPPEITQLTSLRMLTLDGNQLTALPPEITQLTSLRMLKLDGNQLTALPPEITQLTSLQMLTLSGNQLTALPPEITQLTSLQELWLDGNQLTALPPEIAQLTSLRTLVLDGNQLTILPPEIAQLTMLRTLMLDGNQLTALPPEIAQLTRLQELWLNSNQLTALPPEIAQLTSLQMLTLDGNQLTALPPEIAQLTSLQTLQLNSNQLTALPPEIAQLTSLQQLMLNSNQLTALPPEIAVRLDDGLILNLDGNPLAEPLPELMEQGLGAVAIYLRSLRDGIAQYEAKVLLVGEGNVGKTSLSAALRGDAFVERRSFTHGIEIRPLVLPHPGQGVDMTVRLWDFGGQEVYRVTHQFFFSPRGLYLIVWNPREGQEQNDVEGWLRRIRLRAEQDARALVVATHCPDDQRPDLDYPRLQQLFPQLLAGHFDVDNETGHGIGQLQKAIACQAALLPQMGQLISARWIAVRQEVADLARSEPQISFEAFTAICQQHGVDGEEVSTLAALMHDAGQIIYYGEGDSLRDFVVLNPEWLTKAISYVLRDNPTRIAAGELDHARLKEIWQDRQDGPGYSSRYHRYFLRLMEKFDISYRLEEHRSLVAQLVPYERPALPWDWGTPIPSRFRRLALVCKLREPAPGLVAWLTVQRHPDATGLHWRTGVFLRHRNPAYASEALLELRAPDQLAVEVRAPSPDLFFHVLSDTIEALIASRWPGLHYDLLIPCPGTTASGSPCTGLIPMADLLAYREEGLNPYLCISCRTRHDVSALLTGFAPPAPVSEPALGLLTEIASGVVRLEGQSADLADGIRQILRAVTTEVNDCPLLFTLTQSRPQGRRRLRVDQQHYQLVLWCEHPDHWHPWPAATYNIDQTREWLVRISPYANLVLTVLRSAVPIAASASGVLLTADQLKHARSELQLMTTLASELPQLKPVASPDRRPATASRPLAPAQGQAMRAVRTTIFQHDPNKAFGDMRRVLTTAGDYLWICPEHYGNYDPGLPSIPGS